MSIPWLIALHCNHPLSKWYNKKLSKKTNADKLIFTNAELLNSDPQKTIIYFDKEKQFKVLHKSHIWLLTLFGNPLAKGNIAKYTSRCIQHIEVRFRRERRMRMKQYKGNK